MNNEKKEAVRLLKTSKGQIEGILKMIEDDRYCVDISKQLLSVIGLLKKSNNKILEQHMKNCVKEGIEKGNGDEKIEEIINILNIYLK